MGNKIGKLNIKFGWVWLLVGIFEAAFIGMFAFQEGWLGGYVSLTRRLVRLSHIAFMALSILNIIYGLCLEQLDFSLRLKKIGSYSMILAAIFMPTICLLSAINSFFQALFFLPVVFFLIAAIIMVIAQLRNK